jgi:transposase
VPFRLIWPDGVPALQRFHERPRKPAPKEVLMAWAQEWAKEGVAVDWKKLLPPKGPPKGFQVLPRRWVVERTFGVARARPHNGGPSGHRCVVMSGSV